MRDIVAIGMASLALTGCFPYATSYVHLEAAGVGHKQAACRDVGPPVFASYERNGAKIDVTLEPGWAARSKAGFLRVRAPQSIAVSLHEDFGYITPDGQPAIRFELKRVEPPEERFGREILRRQGVLEHRFEFSGLPPIAFSGSLRLPSLLVDGAEVDTPSFRFDRRTYAGVAPMNC